VAWLWLAVAGWSVRATSFSTRWWCSSSAAMLVRHHLSGGVEGLFGACWWCRGGVAGGVGLFLVEASWLQRVIVLSRECAAGMVKVRE
jgi:hypothetical protein